jgi:2-polyprenyl-3-methyl-5-hydroxy-6-metoxy-1,4-benzoquinol methylase
MESTYDIVILLGVLHHLKSIEEVIKALTNIKKLLKPGGRLFSVEPRKTLIRSFLTQLMFALRMRVLPERVKLDRVLVKEELIELNNLLS